MEKIQLLGEYDCKIDAKGRMRIPTDLLKQLGEGGTHTFVINRGFEKNLMLYPKKVWDGIVEKLEKLNPYDPNNRRFIRFMYRGAQVLELDSQDRILIKKQLLDYASIKGTLNLFAHGDQIELWASDEYINQIEQPSPEMIELAGQVMAGVPKEKDEE